MSSLFFRSRLAGASENESLHLEAPSLVYITLEFLDADQSYARVEHYVRLLLAVFEIPLHDS